MSTTARQLPNCFFKDCFCFNKADVAPYWSEIIGYGCGGVFAIGWWIFLDALIYSNAKHLTIAVGFDHWVPGILGTLSLIMVNSVDKNMLNGNDYMYGEGITWKARLFAFLGIALGVGALGGSITIMCLQYLDQVDMNAWMGIALVIQNFMIFFSGMTLWLFRSIDQGTEYSITLS